MAPVNKAVAKIFRRSDRGISSVNPMKKGRLPIESVIIKRAIKTFSAWEINNGMMEDYGG
jgi:hypothetical protein